MLDYSTHNTSTNSMGISFILLLGVFVLSLGAIILDWMFPPTYDYPKDIRTRVRKKRNKILYQEDTIKPKQEDTDLTIGQALKLRRYK